MEFELKKLTPDGIERALEKVERYRLLNEPAEAESICLDVLELQPDRQEAVISLLLALTDQFDRGMSGIVSRAQALLDRLDGEYERAYYAGIICERRGTAILERNTPGAGPVVFDWYRQAMEHYEAAEKLRPPGNDDALLRWNTLARTIQSRNLQPAEPIRGSTFLE